MYFQFQQQPLFRCCFPLFSIRFNGQSNSAAILQISHLNRPVCKLICNSIQLFERRRISLYNLFAILIKPLDRCNIVQPVYCNGNIRIDLHPYGTARCQHHLPHSQQDKAKTGSCRHNFSGFFPYDNWCTFRLFQAKNFIQLLPDLIVHICHPAEPSILSQYNRICRMTLHYQILHTIRPPFPGEICRRCPRIISNPFV